MPQPIKKIIKNPPKPKKKQTTHFHKVKLAREKAKQNQEYGTSKLEERFARDFLDRLGIEYVYQYKMGSLKRYLDFFIPLYHAAIEVDGDYFHSNPLIYEEKDLNGMQKRNKKIDEEKNSWCRRNGIPLIRIWEKDINEHPARVMEYLKETFHIYDEKKKREDEMNKRHNSKI